MFTNCEKDRRIFHNITLMPQDFPNQPPENDEGNKEYKWRLLFTDPIEKTRRCNKLATQMRYRLWEGEGKAIYLIGVNDAGKSVGLSELDLYHTLVALDDIASIISANIDKVRIYKKDHSYVATIRLSNKKICQRGII